MKRHERVKFRLIYTPCCATLLCWVNPRLPNYCPECGSTILAKLRHDPTRILVTDHNAELAMTAEVGDKIEKVPEMVPLNLAADVIAGAMGAAQLLGGKMNVDITENSELVQKAREQLREMAKEYKS